MRNSKKGTRTIASGGKGLEMKRSTIQIGVNKRTGVIITDVSCSFRRESKRRRQSKRKKGSGGNRRGRATIKEKRGRGEAQGSLNLLGRSGKAVGQGKESNDTI